MEHSLKYIIYCIQHSSVCVLSHVQLFATSWTVAHQAPLSMEFSRQENWSGVPFPSPGELPSPGIEPLSLALQVDSLLDGSTSLNKIQRSEIIYSIFS